MALAQGTRSCYMSRLRKLMRAYPQLIEPADKEMCRKEIDRLMKKLDLQYGSPELSRGPGRPRARFEVPNQPDVPTISEEEFEQKSQEMFDMARKMQEKRVLTDKNDPDYWTPKAVADRAKAVVERQDEIVKLANDVKFGETEEVREAARKRLEELQVGLQADPTQAG